MIKLNINLEKNAYPIYITTDYNSLAECLEAAGISGKIVLITDRNVDKFQSEECIRALELAGLNVAKYVIEPGEHSKTLKTVENIYSFLVEQKVERNSVLLALGGGVTGDIAGFVASTYLRGISFVQVPTSLLAQADSSVGGKVGVDFKGGKNLIGAFYQPRLVYINVNSLKTLPFRELQSGLAEVIKHGIILDELFFDYVNSNLERILHHDLDVLKLIAEKNCEIKGKVVEEDEKEKGLRAILNFGHTIGHAIESAMNFKLLHGECISIGMIGAFKLAEVLGMVSSIETEKVTCLLKKVGLPIKLNFADIELVYKQMLLDKKIQDDKFIFILPRRIGEVEQYKINDKKLIMELLNSLR